MMHYLRNSLTIRLTLLFSLAAMLILTILGLITSAMVNEHFVEQDQHDLANQYTHINKRFSQITNSNDLDKALGLLTAELSLSHGQIVVIMDHAANVLFSNEPAVLADIAKALTPDAKLDHLFTWQTGQQDFRGIKKNTPNILSCLVRQIHYCRHGYFAP